MHGFTAPLTSFVGRAGEVAEVADLLRVHRMVTVAGVGGVGKRRSSTPSRERLRGAKRST
jgi:predicted ATPase